MKKSLYFFICLLVSVSFINLFSHSSKDSWCHGWDFDVNFAALFLKPSSSDAHYAAEAIPLPLVTPNWNIYDVPSKYKFGFDLGFKAIENDHNIAFMINWEHFKSCATSSISVGAENMVGPFFEIGPDASAYSLSNGRASYDFNEVNIDIGQYKKFNHKLTANIFAGIGITSIKQKITSFYSNDAGTISRTIFSPRSFVGAGPQFGAFFDYDISCGFSFTGKALFSLLSGNVSNFTNYSSTSPFLEDLGSTSPNIQKTCTQKRFAVVPAFEEKLAIAYQYAFRSCYLFKVEAGYQSQIYIGALQSTDLGSEVITPPLAPNTVGVYARTFQRSVSNFSLAGPYINFNLRF